MTRLMLLLAAEAGAVATAMRVGAPRLTDAIDAPQVLLHLPAGDLGVLLLHLLAPPAAAWLLLGTLHDAAAAIRGGTRTAHTPRWVRRVVDQAVGSAVLVGVMAGPAAAAAPPPAPVAVAAAEVPPSSPPVLPPPAGVALPLPGTDAPPPPAPAGGGTGVDVPPAGGATPDHDEPAEPPAVGEAAHVVSPGENLWVIARGVLLAAGVDAPDDRRVHAYWVELIRDNLPTLRSGDADLVFPGEHLRLPVVEPGR